MGCIASQQKNVSQVKTVKSQAQLEYELNNCYDHFNTISITLQKSQKYIFKSVGKELSSKEYYLIYQKLENQPNQEKTIESFDIFFRAVEQGLQLLPMLLKQSQKLESSLSDRKNEISEFKQSLITHIEFCKNIVLPSHMNSQSTEH
ncbi:hypothetical protein ABPG74_002455 [Tetrahymena malaccensis]